MGGRLSSAEMPPCPPLGQAEMLLLRPDGHFKFPHLWPPKFPQAGRADYELSAGLSARREAASLSR
jgi:hypothetical protein